MVQKTPDPRPNIMLDLDHDEAQIVLRELQEARRKPNALNKGQISRVVDKLFDRLYPQPGGRRRR